MKIYHPPDYAIDPRSHLPEIDPITEYFKFPTLEDTSIEDTDEHDISAITHHAELLRWYYRIVVLSFKTRRLLTNLRIIPYHLREFHLPKCTSCMYGVMTKENWRTKGDANRGRVRPSTQSGKSASVDQLESTTLGFVDQLKGRLTKDRYRFTIIFLDH